MAVVGPGWMGMVWTEVQAAVIGVGGVDLAVDFLPVAGFLVEGLGGGWGVVAVVSAAMVVRQRLAVMGPLMGRLSVVLVGVVQWRMTLSPMRSAVRSVMGWGRLRLGGGVGRGWRSRRSRWSMRP